MFCCLGAGADDGRWPDTLIRAAKRKPEAYQMGDTKPTKVIRTKLEPAKPISPPPTPSRRPSAPRPRRKKESILDRLAEILGEMFG